MKDTTQNQSKNYRSAIIFIFAVVLFFVLLNTLPFDKNANSGLALLALVAILWLTEALHVTITALIVPLLAIFLGLVKTSTALATFADPNIFLFFGGFALAGVTQERERQGATYASEDPGRSCAHPYPRWRHRRNRSSPACSRGYSTRS